MTITRTTIVAEARSWIGTPYRHQASLKGVGCDCLGLVRGVWRAVLGAEPEAVPVLKNRFGLSQLEIDASTRAIVDQGLQKAVGYAITKVQEFTVAKPLSVDVKSDLIKHAVDFALTHIPGALAYFGLDDPQKLAQTIEARLGILAMQTSTQARSPAAPATAA
jgi:NlpC/P60 family putative phage cell wall peptidase